MKKTKKIMPVITAILTLMIFLSVGVCAAEPENNYYNEYYMVDGRIYDEFSAIINRVEHVDNISSVKTKAGEEYLLKSYDIYDYEISSTVISVNFELGADAGGGISEYAEFCVLVPYDESIEYFILYNSGYYPIAEAYLFESVQYEIEYFIIDEDETDGGYNLEWSVDLYDYDSEYMLEYDVMTISQKTGESNVLAYRIKEKSLFVPYDWLEPNDTVVFILKSNDSRITLTETSSEYTTPDGEVKNIADSDKEWTEAKAEASREYFNIEDDVFDMNIVYIIAAIIIGSLVVILVIIIVVFVVIKKKKKINK